MPEQENKALVQRFYEEVWGKGNVAVADEVFSSTYVRHDLRPTDATPGAEGQKQIARAFRAAFPDLRFDVEIVVADGSYVAARWTAAGTTTDACPSARRGDRRADWPIRGELSLASHRRALREGARETRSARRRRGASARGWRSSSLNDGRGITIVLDA